LSLRYHLRLPPLLMLAALVMACVKTPAPASTPSERTEPPRILTRGAFPELSVLAENATSGPPPRLRIQVMVDTLGRADLKTLNLTGIGSGGENRAAIERWLDALLFRPAMRDGQPVNGVFETTLEVRIQQRPF
jgi:hypothetical protein